MKPLRDYQQRGIEMLRTSLRSGKKRPVLQLPTGAGKTRMAAEIINMALNKGGRVIFTVPRVALIDQTVDAFLHEGVVDIGVIQQAHEMTDPSRRVQVCSVDSLSRRDLPPASLVLADEAHMKRTFLYDWMKLPEWLKVPFIGLTATPWAPGMATHWDDLVVVSRAADMIAQGYLSRYRIFAPSHPDLSGVRTQAGDFAVGQLSKAMSKPKLVADVVQTWLERGENRPTLCFCVDRAHAKHVQQRFLAAGVACGYVDCHSTPQERTILERDFRAGTIRVACSVGVLTTGIDWDVRCISLARPTKSEMLFVQMIGRGLRTAPGKQDCLILDHSDTTLRLGFPADIHHGRLDDGKETAKAEKAGMAMAKECPECAFLKPPKLALCPNCGFEAKHGPKAQEVEDGRLIEVTPTPFKRKRPGLDEQRHVYGQLKGYARGRGYSPGWASHKFREMTGSWPGYKVKGAAEAEPTPAVLNWIKSQQIAFAKRQEKEPRHAPHEKRQENQIRHG